MAVKTPTKPKTTKRYQGLIKTARGLFDKQEEVSWRLANVIYDAAEELRRQGFILIDTRDASRRTAFRQITSDVGRPGFGYGTIINYYYTWKKYGDNRKGDLSFQDHVTLYMRGDTPERTELLQQRREHLNASGVRGVMSGSKIAKKPSRSTGAILRPYYHIDFLASHLRSALKQPMKGFPDLDRLMQKLDEIDRLLGNMYKRVEDYSAEYEKASKKKAS